MRRRFVRFWPARLFCWFMRWLGYDVMFYSDHFGHQCGDIARDLMRKRTRLLYLAGIVPNKALRKIHERNATIIDIPGWLKRYFIAADAACKCMSERLSRGVESYNNARDFGDNPKLAFSEDEHQYGRAVLKRLGLEPGKYVCFHARDAGYGNLNHPKMFDERGATMRFGEEAAFQRHRNMDFAAFFSTVEWLGSQGLRSVRLGSDVERKYAANGLVDFASRREEFDNPDLCDLYLMAHCRMFVGQNTGVLMMSIIFNIPSVCVNWFPYAPFSRPTANTIVCRSKRVKNDEETFSEFNSRHVFDWMNWVQFYSVCEKLDVIDNTPDEILQTVQKAMSIEHKLAA